MKKFFLFAAAALMALVGCEKQDQSSLDFANVKQSAKISGQLVYFADKAGSATVETPVVGQRVYFLVAANVYADNAGGNQMFEAITDGEGYFEITVPTGMKAIKGKLMTDIIVLGEAPNRIYLKETEKEITLNAGDAKVEKRVANIDAVLTACQGTGVLKGKVTYKAGVVKKGDVTEDGLVAAPAGVKVMISAKYEDGTRVLIAETKADGTYSYNVPVPAGKSVEAEKIDIVQFEGKYTKEFNNKLTEYDAIYGLKAAEKATMEDGKTVVKDLTAEAIVTVDPTTKTTKFKVKGEIWVEAEELKYSDKEKEDGLCTGVNDKKGKKSYTTAINGGKFSLELRYKDPKTAAESKIVYDLTTNEKNGKYEQEVAIYDNWEYKDVTVYLVVNKFAVTDFKHYYRIYEYQEDSKWKKHDDVWGKMVSGSAENYDEAQNCSGTYEAEIAGTSPDGFFDITLDAIIPFTMTQESKNARRGMGDKDIDQEDGHVLYKDGCPAWN